MHRVWVRVAAAVVAVASSVGIHSPAAGASETDPGPVIGAGALAETEPSGPQQSNSTSSSELDLQLGALSALGAASTDVHAFGAAADLGSLDAHNLRAPVEAIAPTASGKGYWLATALGGVAAFGDAVHHGDLADIDLNFPVVGATPTSSGDGYWMAATDGGVFAFGDAEFYGSMGAVRLNEPVVGMAPTPTGEGYWLVASDGGIFAFGDAEFYGSMGGVPLNQPVVGMAATATGHGYRMVAADGGMFSFGDAQFYGSMGGQDLPAPVEAMRPTPDGDGYWLAGLDGSIYAFGAAPDLGSVTATANGSELPVEGPVSDIAVRPQGDGYWLVEADVGDMVQMWQSRGLDAAVETGIRRAADASGARSAVFHSGTLGLRALYRDGNIVQSATPGWAIPMTAMAFDPDEGLARFGPHVATALLRGETVMGERTARLRGARVGDVVEFTGWDGRLHQRRIGAIAPTLRAGSTELYFSLADAVTFGFSRSISAWVWNFDDREAVLDAIERDVPDAAYFVVSPTWNPVVSDQTLPNVGLKELLGEFQFLSHGNGAITIDPAWVAANIVTRSLPIIGTVTCNSAALGQMDAALAEIQRLGLAYLIDVGDTRSIGGCWVPREVAGATGASISRHAWGVAIDLNPSTNPFGAAPTLDMRIVDVFRRHGFAWGGTWTRPDGMHFEWTGPIG